MNNLFQFSKIPRNKLYNGFSSSEFFMDFLYPYIAEHTDNHNNMLELFNYDKDLAYNLIWNDNIDSETLNILFDNFFMHRKYLGKKTIDRLFYLAKEKFNDEILINKINDNIKSSGFGYRLQE